MSENLSNGAQTTLNGAMDNSQTTATLTSASGWPVAPFRALITAEGGNVDEIIYVGARSGTALSSITRAAEPIADGTQVAVAHSSGATITQVLTRVGLLDQGLNSGTIGALTYLATNTALGISSYTQLNIFDTEVFDTDAFHSTSSNNCRFTIPAGLAGKYLLTLHTYCSGANGQFTAIKKNGSTYIAYDGPMTSADTMTDITLMVDAVGGDYYEAFYGGPSTTWQANACWWGISKLDSGRVGGGTGATAYHSTTQGSLASATYNSLNMDSEEFDTDGFHSTSSNTSRMTIPTGLAGKYVVIFAGSVNQTFYVGIKKNGTPWSIASGTYPSGGAASVSTVMDLVADDYIEGYEYHSSGTGIAGAATADNRTKLSIMRLDSSSSNLLLSGTAFPASPGTNSRFFRTDRSLEYYYDGTRWLTMSQYVMALPVAATAGVSASDLYLYFPIHRVYQTWVDRLEVVFYASGLTGGAYWTAELNKETAAEVQTTLGSVNIQSGTNNNWLPRSVDIGAAVDPSTYSNIALHLFKTGSPGASYLSGQMYFRLIG